MPFDSRMFSAISEGWHADGVRADSGVYAFSGRCACAGCQDADKGHLLRLRLADPGHAPQGAPADDGPQSAGDGISDSITGASLLTIGSPITSLIDHDGDIDYFRIELVAGQAYQFNVVRGTLADPYLEIRDSTGAVLEEDDDGGLWTDSSELFIAPTTGTYYLSVHFWESAAGTGSYTISANEVVTGNTSPTSFVSPTGLPVFSWEQAALQLTRNGATWAADYGEAVTITYAFRSSEPTTMPDGVSGFSRFSDAQIAAAEHVLAQWAAVTNITFVRVGTGTGDAAYSNAAEILFANYSTGQDGAAAFAYLPSRAGQSDFEGDVWVNSSIDANQDLAFGGYGLHTLLHEVGHALGLSHPGDYDAGDDGDAITYDNSAEYYQDSRALTVMSYFGSPPVGANLGAFASTPQMHDIAAIQRLYGVNTTTRTGDTVYGFNSTSGQAESTLTSPADAAVFTIWDAGGNDTLDLSGYTQGGIIDLRPEAFSSVFGWSRNISIARGVIIENAIGGVWDETIIGNSADNILSGGDGADHLVGGLGNDLLNGGNGTDTASYASETGAVFAHMGWGYAAGAAFLGAGGADIGEDTLVSIESLSGGAGNDVLIIDGPSGGGAGGGAGDDWIESAGAGYASLNGGAGNDALIGGAGGNNISGGDGDDGVIGGASADSLSGGAGIDWLLGYGGDDTGWGGEDTDIIIGGDGADDLRGEGGNDAVIGDGGADTLFGDAGDDWVEGGAGNDTLSGGEGADTLLGQDGDDRINAGAGNDGISGGAGVDTLFGEDGDDYITAEDGADTLNGGAGNDGLFGGAGANVYYGGDGNDGLIGGGDAEQMFGENGGDWLQGWGGADRLSGGAGADAFVYSTNTDSLTTAMDRILDFNRLDGDVIKLDLVDADWIADGDQAFTIVSAFSNQAGQMTTAYNAGANITILSFDLNGDGLADMAIEVVGNVTQTSDFVL